MSGIKSTYKAWFRWNSLTHHVMEREFMWDRHIYGYVHLHSCQFNFPSWALAFSSFCAVSDKNTHALTNASLYTNPAVQYMVCMPERQL